jgi:hypothetical protein
MEPMSIDSGLDAAALSTVIALLMVVGMFVGLIAGRAKERARFRDRCPHPENFRRCYHGDARMRENFGYPARCMICELGLEELPLYCTSTGQPHGSYDPPALREQAALRGEPYAAAERVDTWPGEPGDYVGSSPMAGLADDDTITETLADQIRRDHPDAR